MPALRTRFSAVALAAALSLPIPAAADESLPAALDAATEQVRLLFGRTDRLLDAYEGTRETAGIHLDRFKLTVGEHAVPLAAFGTFVPRGLKGRGDGRVGIFGAGDVRLDPEGTGLESDGLSLGADFGIRRRMSFGGAIGYSRLSAGPDAISETTTAAAYGAGRRGELTIEAVAGSGFARETERQGQGRPVLFSGSRTRWNLTPLPERAPRLKLSPSVSVTAALGTGARVAGSTAAVRTKLAASHEIHTGWGLMAPRASIERTVEVATTPHREPSSSLRFGIASQISGGPKLSVEHAAHWDGRTAAHQTVIGRFKLRF